MEPFSLFSVLPTVLCCLPWKWILQNSISLMLLAFGAQKICCRTEREDLSLCLGCLGASLSLYSVDASNHLHPHPPFQLWRPKMPLDIARCLEGGRKKKDAEWPQVENHWSTQNNFGHFLGFIAISVSISYDFESCYSEFLGNWDVLSCPATF